MVATTTDRVVDLQTGRDLAVFNRRLNRASRKSIEREKREEREARERAVAHRMSERFYRGQIPALMVLDYRYWQARRCGWDMLGKAFATDARGCPLRRDKDDKPVELDGEPWDATRGVSWQFWTTLHYKVREQLVTLSTFRLIRH